MKSLMTTLAGLLCAALVSIGASVAETGDWDVVETSGTVRTSQAMAGIQQVSTGNVLGAGSILSTGANGHAVLMRGEQQIVVGPNSRMSLPLNQESGMTKIVQDLGTLLFKVDKKEKQHFQVETPIIAAVVCIRQVTNTLPEPVLPQFPQTLMCLNRVFNMFNGRMPV